MVQEGQRPQKTKYMDDIFYGTCNLGPTGTCRRDSVTEIPGLSRGLSEMLTLT